MIHDFFFIFAVKEEPTESDNLASLAPDFKPDLKSEDIKNFDDNLLGNGMFE